MKAIVLVKIATGEVQETFHFLKKLRCVSEAYITFGPYDSVVIIEAANLAEVGRIVACDIQPIPGVVQTLTCLATEVWQPNLATQLNGSRAFTPAGIKPS
jgi:DNA-binding Lrp family transcriptional regulator